MTGEAKRAREEFIIAAGAAFDAALRYFGDETQANRRRYLEAKRRADEALNMLTALEGATATTVTLEQLRAAQ